MYLFDLPILGAWVKPFDLWHRDHSHDVVMISYASAVVYLVVVFVMARTNHWFRLC